MITLCQQTSSPSVVLPSGGSPFGDKTIEELIDMEHNALASYSHELQVKLKHCANTGSQQQQ